MQPKNLPPILFNGIKINENNMKADIHGKEAKKHGKNDSD